MHMTYLTYYKYIHTYIVTLDQCEVHTSFKRERLYSPEAATCWPGLLINYSSIIKDGKP